MTNIDKAIEKMVYGSHICIAAKTSGLAIQTIGEIQECIDEALALLLESQKEQSCRPEYERQIEELME